MSQQDGEVRRFTVDAISDGGEIVLSDQRGRLYYEKDGALCLASDYDALAARLAEAERKVAAMQEVVNVASLVDQCNDSDEQDSDEDYEMRLKLADAVERYRAVLARQGGG